MAVVAAAEREFMTTVHAPTGKHHERAIGDARESKPQQTVEEMYGVFLLWKGVRREVMIYRGRNALD